MTNFVAVVYCPRFRPRSFLVEYSYPPFEWRLVPEYTCKLHSLKIYI